MGAHAHCRIARGHKHTVPLHARKKGGVVMKRLQLPLTSKDIKELKDFKILYISQGHEDFISIKGEKIPRRVRYIQVFKR